MKIKLIHFSSPSCSICTTQEIVLNNIHREYNIEVADHPITTHFDEALQFGVKSAPTLVYVLDGRPVQVAIGYQDESKIKSRLESMGFELSKMAD